MAGMMANLKPNPYTEVVPKIYAYTTPEIRRHDGWTKIGYTEQADVVKRIEQQTKTADIEFNLEWQGVARYVKEPQEYFKDYDFHNYLQRMQKVERQSGTEWFHIDGARSQNLFRKFTARDYADIQGKQNGNEYSDYVLREEQASAVAMTADYIAAGTKPREFLWNAKPRFGKTLAAYDLARKIRARHVLIVTNRPSIANSWYDDFARFIGWQTKYRFVSETDALSERQTLTREQFINLLDSDEKLCMLAFESLQGLKGSHYFGGNFDKLKWIRDIEWDLLVIDEAHEGVDTYKTDRAFEEIRRKFTLHLSGTPFKAIANNKFSSQQIYNWSYGDEQEAKLRWEARAAELGQEASNPYGDLPRLNMYTYQLSKMIADTVNRGMVTDEGDELEYAFDLNEFFSTKSDGSFQHDKDVDKFLDRLTTNEKFPFSTPELRSELAHTFWLMDRVASAKAMAKKLRAHPVFGEYEIVLAAGDGRDDEMSDNKASRKSFDRVQEAIAKHDKTITLSVGQLTTGITVKPWTAVLMLSNMKSPAEYMQAAFRAQNPYQYEKDGVLYKKENAYVFDFSPERTLIVFDEFANSLRSSTAAGRGTEEERKENIRRLLNFFPVIGEDSEGRMVQLDAAQVLSIPRAIKAEEVVNRGFMSNFLFANISNVFSAPEAVKEILQNVEPAREENRSSRRNEAPLLEGADELHIDEQGKIDVPEDIVVSRTDAIFGSKVYADIPDDFAEAFRDKAKDYELSRQNGLPSDAEKKAVPLERQLADNLSNHIFAALRQDIDEAAKKEYGVKARGVDKLNNQIKQQVTEAIDKITHSYTVQSHVLEKEEAEAVAAAEAKAQLEPDAVTEVNELKAEYEAKREEARERFIEEIHSQAREIQLEAAQTAVRELEKGREEVQQHKIENDLRAHLRGFCRTIPSFIMAYGDDDLRLSNFERYVSEDVFQEVTSITMQDFLFLRDGGEYVDEETGERRHFDGQLFDEGTFDDSIKTFLEKRDQLKNYFAEGQEEDIFDYIPPQKTNQIYTQKWIVKLMADFLEQENPGIFDDSTKNFADLYMKSGLYITEIVKRLYNSEKIKAEYPDDHARLKHIFEHQVYGMAPSKIIFAIAMRYIFGFADGDSDISRDNFRQIDTAEYAKQGKMQELLNREFCR